MNDQLLQGEENDSFFLSARKLAEGVRFHCRCKDKNEITSIQTAD